MKGNAILLGGLSALLLTGGSSILPRPWAPAAMAQQAVTLSTTTRDSQSLYLSSDTTHEYALQLTNGATVNGLALPANSLIRGRFEPVEGGLQFIAEAVESGNQVYSLNATSQVLRDQKDPRETSTGAILGDAAIGAAGGYVLGEVLGDADFLEVIGGAAAGVIVGNTTAPFVVVLEPEQSIFLTTQ
ncbi:MAG: hypothetical protein AAF243_17355 [Cyanobacteria bacterium P01_A01_bin.137]